MGLAEWPLGPELAGLIANAGAYFERIAADGGRKAAIVHVQSIRSQDLSGEVEEERGLQWPVDDQPGVTLDTAGIRCIVVDTVAVEGYGGLAKQQRRCGRHSPVVPAGFW